MNECYEKEEVGELLSSWKGLIERGGVIGGESIVFKVGLSWRYVSTTS